MNIEAIKNIVNLNVDDPIKRDLILKEIAHDEKAIPYVLSMLTQERKLRGELIVDLNLNLSRAHTGLVSKEMLKHLMKNNFINNELRAFYKKWVQYVSPCFNNKFTALTTKPKKK